MLRYKDKKNFCSKLTLTVLQQKCVTQHNQHIYYEIDGTLRQLQQQQKKL